MKNALSLSAMKKLLLIYQKIYMGERRENKPQTAFWPGTDEGFRQELTRLSLQSCLAHQKVSECLGASVGFSRAPLVSQPGVGVGEGDSPEK